MRLLAGEHYFMEQEGGFFLLQSGRAEVYAQTQWEQTEEQEKRNPYHQVFLTELQAGDAAFPAMDEDQIILFHAYAVEDCEIEILPLSADSGMPADVLRALMRAWFSNLLRLPWLRLMADHGDDVLMRWADGTVLEECEDFSGLLSAFIDNEQILEMFLSVRFQSEDMKFSAMAEESRYRKFRLMDAAIGNLLGEDEERPIYNMGNAKLAEATFIVRRIAESLGMPAEHVSIAPEIVHRLDPLAIVRCLMQKGNMQMRLVKLADDWYEKDSGTLLGYYGKKKELAAIFQIRPGHYRIVTQSCPEGKALTEAMAKELQQDAFQCYAGLPAKKLHFSDLRKFMLKQCWKGDYWTIAFVGFFAGLIPLVTPVITETIFQDILPILDRQGLATVTQVSMASSFTLAALSLVRSVAVLRITTHLDMATEAALWGRLLSLPTKFFRRFSSGELAQRMDGINQVKAIVSGEVVTGICNFIFSFFSLFLMLWYSIRLTLFALGVWIAYVLFAAFIYRRAIYVQREAVDAENRTAGLVQQIFTGLMKFRIQGAEEQAYFLWSKVFGEHWKWIYALRWQSNHILLLSKLQPLVLTMVLYYVASTYVGTADGIDYSKFLAFQAAYTAFNGSLNTVIPLVGQCFSIRPHIENLKPVLEEEPETTEDKMDADALSGTLEALHLTFAYRPEGPDVLHDVSFRISAGESVAIVGRSGCGKSTLIRLLLGFEQPNQGAVYYDGHDLSSLSLPSVRSQLGVVLQNGQLMAGDIFMNIVGTTALTQADAWAAAEAAGIAADIREMPMGMQTVISEGSSNISGGQRQRILIARALAANPSLVVFDEATSALDNRTQAIVMDSLKKLKATRIVVAHRLSTIRDCDRILVMERGRIAESGTFDELLAKGGIFAGLAKRQMA